MLYFIRVVGPGIDKLIPCKNYLSALKLYKNFDTDSLAEHEIYFLYLISVEKDPCFRFFSQEEVIDFIYSKYLINCQFDVLYHRAIFIPRKES